MKTLVLISQHPIDSYCTEWLNVICVMIGCLVRSDQQMNRMWSEPCCQNVSFKIIQMWVFCVFCVAGVPFLITAELFKQSHRPAAYTVAGCLNWLSNFTIGFVFPFLEVRANSNSALGFWFWNLLILKRPKCVADLMGLLSKIQSGSFKKRASHVSKCFVYFASLV